MIKIVDGPIMTRILISHMSPIPNKITGITTYTWKMIESFSKYGKFDYVVNTNWDTDNIPDSIKSTGFQINSYKIARNEAASIILNSFMIPNISRKYNCDLTFFPQPTSMLGKSHRRVVTIHDLYRMTHPSTFTPAQRWQWRMFTSLGFRQASAVIAVSHATRDDIARFYPDLAGRTYVVQEASPLEIDKTLIPRTEKNNYGIFVANITKNKNVEVLIEAMKLIKNKFPNFKMIVIGRDDGGFLSKNDNANHINVENMSGISEFEISVKYANAIFYVNCSIVEGFCLPILEAQEFNIPVICSDIPVLREVAGSGALFFDPTDAKELAGTMERLLRDPALVQEMRERSTANVRRFSWERAVREAEAVFETALASTP